MDACQINAFRKHSELLLQGQRKAQPLAFAGHKGCIAVLDRTDRAVVVVIEQFRIGLLTAQLLIKAIAQNQRGSPEFRHHHQWNQRPDTSQLQGFPPAAVGEDQIRSQAVFLDQLADLGNGMTALLQ